MADIQKTALAFLAITGWTDMKPSTMWPLTIMGKPPGEANKERFPFTDADSVLEEARKWATEWCYVLAFYVLPQLKIWQAKILLVDDICGEESGDLCHAVMLACLSAHAKLNQTDSKGGQS